MESNTSPSRAFILVKVVSEEHIGLLVALLIRGHNG